MISTASFLLIPNDVRSRLDLTCLLDLNSHSQLVNCVLPNGTGVLTTNKHLLLVLRIGFTLLYCVL